MTRVLRFYFGAHDGRVEIVEGGKNRSFLYGIFSATQQRNALSRIKLVGGTFILHNVHSSVKCSCVSPLGICHFILMTRCAACSKDWRLVSYLIGCRTEKSEKTVKT